MNTTHLSIHSITLMCLLLMACGPAHIQAYKPRVRDYTMPVKLSESDAQKSEGSLWSEGSSSNFLFADQRAMRLGDVLTVRVEEFANAQRDATTNLSRQSEINAQVKGFLSLIKKLQKTNPDIDPEALIDAQTASKFNGSGATGRTESVKATVPVMVKKVLPNGNLFVEGHRVILVNNEEHHFYVSGVARPQDINQANTISSTRLADAEVEFTGRGVITDQQRQGWFSTYFGWMWPF